MNNITNFKNIVGASNGEQAHMLGKFLYFSLSNILVEKEPLIQLCEQLGIPYAGGKRISVSDAFRSATGDIKDRLVSSDNGERRIYAVYCRDNEQASDLLSRELVKETLNEQTNRYEKLANIYFDRRDQRFGYENICYDADVDAAAYCLRAEELFELYQRCANRRQIETICQAYLRSLEATKVSSTGYLYFVPRQHNYHLGKLERTLAKADLLILDELSYLSFNRHQSELLFKVISDRSEKSSTIVTTNLPFSKWTDLFENTTMVAALIDRLTFRSHVLDMNGDSYRLKATMQNKA